MEARILTDEDRKQYEEFVEKSPTGHIVQSWSWGEFKDDYGNKITRIGVFDGNKLVSAASYTLHKVPYTNYFVGYLPKGPVVDSVRVEPLQILLEKLTEVAKAQHCLFVRLEPNFLTSEKYHLPKRDNLVMAPKNIFAPHTLLLDLTLGEDELLKNMHEKWRYNIRLSDKKEVVVKESDDIDSFVRIQRETAQRDKFFIHPDHYYQNLWKKLHPLGYAALLQATHEKDVLVSWLLFKFGDKLYYPYGASSSEKRNLMPSHAMMWAAIKWGKDNGCKVFDLWGASPEEADSNDPWAGFTTFKLGFGAKRVSFLGTYDLVINPKLYKLFNLTDNLRWKILRTFR
jgi:lipid II:glycine glycyltransferase (peptidoglycan interpeptide bridge formation enzyme)